MSLVETIKKDEGFSGEVYQCTEGFDTIGYGTKLPLSKEESELILNHRLKQYIDGLNAKLYNLHIKDEAWDILYNMAYQMGVHGVLKFQNTIVALQEQNYELASMEMMDSKWYAQTPKRAKRLIERMRNLA